MDWLMMMGFCYVLQCGVGLFSSVRRASIFFAVPFVFNINILPQISGHPHTPQKRSLPTNRSHQKPCLSSHYSTLIFANQWWRGAMSDVPCLVIGMQLLAGAIKKDILQWLLTGRWELSQPHWDWVCGCCIHSEKVVFVIIASAIFHKTWSLSLRWDGHLSGGKQTDEG